jgi:hypothetical protein
MLDLIPGEDFKKISQHLHQVSKNKKSFWFAWLSL